jgi:hypothetical protein
MATDFLPSREADLVTWSANFSALILATPSAYGLTPAQAVGYQALNDAYAAAYQTANDPSTRSPASIVTKNTAKTSLITNARLLAGIVQKFPATTNTQRTELGLTVKDAGPTPIPPPAEMPVLEVTERFGTTVKIKLHDGSGARRGKPAGVAGASVFSFVGPAAPSEIGDWKFEGNTMRPITEIDFAPTLSPGTLVWMTAFWFNPKGESGPGCAPVSTNIAGGAMQQAA